MAMFDMTRKHDTIFCRLVFSVNKFVSKWATLTPLLPGLVPWFRVELLPNKSRTIKCFNLVFARERKIKLPQQKP